MTCAYSQVIISGVVPHSYLPYAPCAGGTVNFYTMDTMPQFNHSLHYWSFGDGGTASAMTAQPMVSHVYTAPGTYLVTCTVWDTLYQFADSSAFYITVETTCNNSDLISGNTYHDDNGNGTQDPGEANWPYRFIHVQPGNGFLSSDANGNWAAPFPAGTYQFSCVVPLYQQMTEPSSGSYSVVSTGTGLNLSGNNFGFDSIPNNQDLRIHLGTIPPVPGFTRNYWLRYENVGTTTENATVTLDYDPSLIFVYADPGSTHTGNRITWTLPNLAPGASSLAFCQLTIPTNTVIGSMLSYTATINPIPNDVVPADNVHNLDMEVLSSYDPNDKAVMPAGLGATGDIAPGTRLTYTIRFQNTGNFAATDVVLRDTLDDDLDQSTLEIVGGSHPFTWHNDFGKLKFDFHNIMLPDSGSNEPGSHGLVTYRISPKSTSPLGTMLTNTAYIYFDFNAPVVTNTTLNTLATIVTGLQSVQELGLRVAPNPFSGSTMLYFDNVHADDFTLTLRDTQGKLVRKCEHITGGQYPLDANDLPAGLYIFTLQHGENIMASGKMIVQ